MKHDGIRFFCLLIFFSILSVRVHILFGHRFMNDKVVQCYFIERLEATFFRTQHFFLFCYSVKLSAQK